MDWRERERERERGVGREGEREGGRRGREDSVCEYICTFDWFLYICGSC